MESELDKKLIATVVKNVPKNQKTVNYLVNKLHLSRESAYRRIRGDIPFTVNELTILAVDLNFSIDHLLEGEKQNHSFYDFTRTGKNSTNYFLLMLRKYNELLEKINDSKKLETIMAFNSFPPIYYAGYFYLYKFAYYQWLFQENGISRSDTLSKIAVPDEILYLQKKVRANSTHEKDSTLILDVNIFLNLMKEIQYFYQRKLITNEELLLLKEDILHLIKHFEDVAQSGFDGPTKVQLYLSSLCVNSNTVCYRFDDKVEPLFWIFTINPVVIQNPEFASMQLKWLNTIKRHSALITQSNEIMQADFFSQQLEYTDRYLNTDIPK
jgi:hypothetical protein